MMDETNYNLFQSQTVTIDSNGVGEIRFGPAQYSERWEIQRITTQSPTAGGTLTLYRNYVSTNTMIDVTLKVEGDVCDTPIPLLSGETLVGYYTNCNPGAQIMLTVHGDKYIKGRRSYGV